jgi:hypothetical protein
MLESIIELDDGILQSSVISPLNFIGAGRGAQVNLVECDYFQEKLVAEKVYSPAGIKGFTTKLVYNLAFQAPFPYAFNHHAIRAAYYRRKLLTMLSNIWRSQEKGIPYISDSLYTRWHNEKKIFVLGTEYIDGRHVLPSEMDGLLKTMDIFYERLIHSGLFGVAWQDEPGNFITGVATTNFIHHPSKGWHIVDLESAVPPPSWKYLKLCLNNNLSTIPLFDDIDFVKLKDYINDDKQDIQTQIEYSILVDILHKLEFHTKEWKLSEIALFRHGFQPLYDSELQASVRREYAHQKHLINNIDIKTFKSLETSNQAYLAYLIKDNANIIVDFIKKVPGKIKDNLQNLYNSMFGALLEIQSTGFDKYVINKGKNYVEHKITEWEQLERISIEKAIRLRDSLTDPQLEYFMQDAGAHLCSLALSPPFIADAGVIATTIITGNPNYLLALGISPFVRFTYSTAKLIMDTGRRKNHIIPMLTGWVPTLGNAAYYLTHPFWIRFENNLIDTIQKKTNSEVFENLRFKGDSSINEISNFTFYAFLSDIAESLPIYGGKHTRIDETIRKITFYSDYQ